MVYQLVCVVFSLLVILRIEFYERVQDRALDLPILLPRHDTYRTDGTIKRTDGVTSVR